MANWLYLDKIEGREFSLIMGFQYDSVSDAQILRALGDPQVLCQVSPALDWEDDEWLAESTAVACDDKHAYRVAALVALLQEGGTLTQPIELDTFLAGRCANGIGNGHHRIRALQYLGVPVAPFSLSGALDMLEDLVKGAGAPGPGVHAQYFSPELIDASDDDIPLKAVA